MTDYAKARRHLMRRDPRLVTIIKQVGPFNLSSVPPQPPFMALTHSTTDLRYAQAALAHAIAGGCRDVAALSIGGRVLLVAKLGDTERRPYLSVAVMTTVVRISISPATIGVCAGSSAMARAAIMGTGGG